MNTYRHITALALALALGGCASTRPTFPAGWLVDVHGVVRAPPRAAVAAPMRAMRSAEETSPCAPGQSTAWVEIERGEDDAIVSSVGPDTNYAALACTAVTVDYNVQATRMHWPPWYASSVGLLRFDTHGVVPAGSNIVAAYYRYWVTGARDDDHVGQTLDVRWYDPPSGTWSCADWARTPTGIVAGSKPLSNYECGGGYACDEFEPIDIPLTNLDQIDRCGTTGLRLFISERPDGLPPVGVELVYPIGWEDGHATDRQSYLALCYVAPPACP